MSSNTVSVLLLAISIGVCVNSYVYNYYPPYPANNTCQQPNYNATGTHSLFIGCVTRFDRLLYSQPFQKNARFLTIRDSFVKYPLPGYNRNETISAIWVFDQDRNGTGGYAYVQNGGVGFRNVTIRLYSARSRGFNFHVSIYGH